MGLAKRRIRPKTPDPELLGWRLVASNDLVAVEPDDAVVHWSFELHVADWADELDADDLDDGCAEDVGEAERRLGGPAGAGDVLARVELFTFDPYGPVPVSDALDAAGSDEAAYLCLFQGGRLDDALLEGGGGSQLVVLDRVWVEPAWRGRRLGMLAAAEALNQLRGLAAIIACFPAPFEEERGTPEWDAAQARLEALWGRFGFEPWRDGVWVLHPEYTTLGDTRAALLDGAEADNAGRYGTR